MKYIMDSNNFYSKILGLEYFCIEMVPYKQETNCNKHQHRRLKQ